MDGYGLMLAVVFAVILVAIAIYAARARRAQRLREAEARRPVDKGKHVEL